CSPWRRHCTAGTRRPGWSPSLPLIPKLARAYPRLPGAGCGPPWSTSRSLFGLGHPAQRFARRPGRRTRRASSPGPRSERRGIEMREKPMCLGIPGQVIELQGAPDGLASALVEFAGLRRRVCTACVPDVRPGDYVIVHAGIAISRLDPDEAGRVLEYLRELGDTEGWEGQAEGGGETP